MKKLIAGLAVICLCISLLTACADESPAGTVDKPAEWGDSSIPISTTGIDLTGGPAEILPRLQKAYNSQDLYAIVECFDPSIAEAYWGIAELFGLKADAIAQILPFFSQLLAGSGALDNAAWGTVELTALDYEIEDSNGELTYNVTLSYTDGTSRSFDETVDVVFVDGTWYIAATQSMDISGTTIVPEPIPVVDGITEADVADGLFEIHTGSQYGFINISGKVIIDPFFADIGSFTGGYCPVLYEDGNFSKWGFIDQMGNLVVDYAFEAVSSKSVDGYWAVQHNGKWGFYNVETSESIGFQYDSCYHSADGYWAVSQDKKWGFINPATGSGVACQYDDCGDFNVEATIVKKGGYWGAIDKDNNTVVDFIYNEMSNFNNGIAKVGVNSGIGIISSDGNYVIELTKEVTDFDEVYIGNNDFIAVRTSGQSFNIYNRKGEFLQSCYRFHGIYGAKALLAVYDKSYTHNLITIDSTGKIVTDFNTDIVENLSYEVRNGVINIHDKKLLNEYLVLDILVRDPNATASYYNASAVNLMNNKGELLLSTWGVARIATSDLYVSIYDMLANVSHIFDADSNEIMEVPGEIKFSSKSVAYTFSYENGKVYYSLSTKEKLKYTEVADNPDNTALIVYDDIFYGLYYNGELLGSGLTYNEITYDAGLEVFTLKLGAETQRIRIGRDGTVNILE